MSGIHSKGDEAANGKRKHNEQDTDDGFHGEETPLSFVCFYYTSSEARKKKEIIAL